MSAQMRRTLIFTTAALLVLVFANGLLLWGVARNRGGTPEAELLLSGREFHVPQTWRSENSGRFLELRYQYLRSKGKDGNWFLNPWLDRAKLQTLDFRLPAESDTAANPDAVPRFPQKKVFLVLELNGPAYAQALAQAGAEAEAMRLSAGAGKEEKEEAEENLREMRDEASRLFIVDAGLDAQALRQQYPAREQYAIVPGLLHLWRNSHPQHGEPHWYSSMGLRRQRIFVPLEFAGQLRNAASQASGDQLDEAHAPASLRVRLAFGQKLEPWIKAMTMGDAGQGQP